MFWRILFIWLFARVKCRFGIMRLDSTWATSHRLVAMLIRRSIATNNPIDSNFLISLHWKAPCMSRFSGYGADCCLCSCIKMEMTRLTRGRGHFIAVTFTFARLDKGCSYGSSSTCARDRAIQFGCQGACLTWVWKGYQRLSATIITQLVFEVHTSVGCGSRLSSRVPIWHALRRIRFRAVLVNMFFKRSAAQITC